VLLKGGSEATKTNQALIKLVHAVLEKHGLDPRAAFLLAGRQDVAAVLDLHGTVDLIVARGSSEFVRYIQGHTRIPVMGHAAGVCHVYLHAAAEPAMAARTIVDAKTTYAAACNAAEALLWDPGAGAALDACVTALAAAGVEMRACAETLRRHPTLVAAKDTDFGFEFGAPIIAIKQVPDLDAAIAFVDAHGSRHTEAIITNDEAAAEKFLAEVDAAGVYHNASTRFADGYRYGLGAEVGISTDKLHARGPVGVDGLLTYRWLLRGAGQLTADYGPDGKAYKFRDL
jgi:glutamate-5-semialdehyde dehydrogenase